MSKLERFTNNARLVLKSAQDEARNMNHNYIGTEHLLLGLFTHQDDIVVQVLHEVNVDEEFVRKNFLTYVGKGERQPFGVPTLAPRTKTVIELAVNARNQLNHKYIDTAHLLLGLVEEGNGMAIEILKQTADTSLLKELLMDRISEGSKSSARLQGNFLAEVRARANEELLRHLELSALYENRLKWASERAAQEERNRIARDLHDSIKQQLFNIKVSTAAVQERWDSDSAGAKAALADVQESAQAAMVEMNALLMQLSPEPLEKTGLVEALREQCQALAFRTGAQVSTAFGELPPEPLLSSSAQVALFRIAQEALANIARHARAKNVRLRLDSLFEEGAILLEINDDGLGFEPGKTPNGMGITNMKERTESLNGTIEITSQTNGGTTVTVKIPFLDALDDAIDAAE